MWLVVAGVLGALIGGWLTSWWMLKRAEAAMPATAMTSNATPAPKY
jgi:uncharacterized membrane protein YeaQ/YmgE (transglycosylase-associated protein family)